MNVAEQAVRAPQSSSHTRVEQLAYVESFDAVADRDYALVVYKETRTDSGKWVVRIRGAGTPGTLIDPDSAALKSAIKKAAGHDEPYLVWGFNLQSKGDDPRLIENRILLDGDGKPSAVEVHLVTRKADHSPREEKTVTVAWPA